jgi:transposase
VVETDYQIYVGIDWGSEAHQACVLDHERRIVAERSFAHAGDAIAEFAQWLRELADDPGRVAIAIEIPRGAIVETLVERGFEVYAINPKQLDRFRDRYSMSGAKDDRRDAFVLADSLHTDQLCFRRVRLDDPRVIQLRELSRADEDLQREGNQLANRLREQLHRFYVQALKLCSSADEPWLWTLLELAPSPSVARRLRPKRVERLLHAHRIRRLSAEEVVSALQAPALTVAPGVVDAATEHIALLLPRLRLVHSQRQRCGARIEALLHELQAADDDAERPMEYSDVAILRSVPGVGRIVAATIIAEASAALTERDYRALRCHAGIAPVTKQSGKQRMVLMRYACNGRLRHAFYHCARVAVIRDLPSKSYYTALRRRGHTHGRALRAVADRLLRILIAMLTTRTLFDCSKAQTRGVQTLSEEVISTT